MGTYKAAKNEAEYQEGIATIKRVKQDYEQRGKTAVEMAALHYKDMIESKTVGGTFITKAAEASCEIRTVWDTLNVCAQKLLREGKPLPPELSAWTADVLADAIATPNTRKRSRPRKSSKDESKNVYRDLYIYNSVKFLCGIGWTATRNDTTRPRYSACDAVAEVYGLSFDYVKDIWESFD